MELSYQAIKTSKQAREADEMRTEARRRSLLVLIFNYLMDEGYADTASTLEQETNLSLRRLEVCDNVDLDTIIMEYESYYYVKFQKYPKLTKRLPEPGDSRSARMGIKKRTPCAVTQALPRINSFQRPSSKGGLKKTESKLAIRDIDKDSSISFYLKLIGGKWRGLGLRWDSVFRGNKCKYCSMNGDNQNGNPSKFNCCENSRVSCHHVDKSITLHRAKRSQKTHACIRRENGLSGAHDAAEFGLNVSPIMRNGAAEDAQVKRGHVVDYRGLIQDAIKGPVCNTTNGLTCNPEPSERLLKPLSAFSGMNSEMRELAAVISRDIYLDNPNVRWDDIIGLEDAKRLVKEAVVYPIKYPQLFTGILSPWKGLLLYGPPGTGKTLLAKAVATECQTTFFNISTSTIVSKWRGDSEKLVRVLFELARYHAPSTIFLDELESVMSQRGAGQGGEHEGSRRMKTELLVQMDGLAHSDDLVFVLAASNLPWELDHGMLRRLEKRILVGLPSQAARQAMITHWLPPVSNSGGVELRTQLDYSLLGQEMEGYSGSDVKLACKEAAMRPVRKIFDALENQFGNSSVPTIELETVTTADFMDVLAHTKPSVRNLMEKYEAWEKEYQSV